MTPAEVPLAGVKISVQSNPGLERRGNTKSKSTISLYFMALLVGLGRSTYTEQGSARFAVLGSNQRLFFSRRPTLAKRVQVAGEWLKINQSRKSLVGAFAQSAFGADSISAAKQTRTLMFLPLQR